MIFFLTGSNQRNMKIMKGGAERIVPLYQEPKNSPFVQLFKKKYIIKEI